MRVPPDCLLEFGIPPCVFPSEPSFKHTACPETCNAVFSLQYAPTAPDTLLEPGKSLETFNESLTQKRAGLMQPHDLNCEAALTLVAFAVIIIYSLTCQRLQPILCAKCFQLDCYLRSDCSTNLWLKVADEAFGPKLVQLGLSVFLDF